MLFCCCRYARVKWLTGKAAWLPSRCVLIMEWWSLTYVIIIVLECHLHIWQAQHRQECMQQSHELLLWEHFHYTVRSKFILCTGVQGLPSGRHKKRIGIVLKLLLRIVAERALSAIWITSCINVNRFVISYGFLLHTVAWAAVHWCLRAVSLMTSGKSSALSSSKWGSITAWSVANPVTASPLELTYPPSHLSWGSSIAIYNCTCAY